MTKKQYLYEVELALRDLPWKVRRDLIADLDRHLDEVSVESLGSAEAYAAELRESAGLERRRGLVAFLRARRPRNLAIVAALLVAVALIASAVAWVDSYQPLRFAYGETLPDNVRSDVPDRDVVTFHDGRPFAFGITVENSGGFTVRIERVPLLFPGNAYPFTGRVFMSGVLKNGGVYPPFVPFRPFDLKPGQVRLLFIRGTYTNCHDYSPRTGFVLAAFPVTFSFLWRTETERIPLSSQLVVQIPAGRRCLR